MSRPIRLLRTSLDILAHARPLVVAPLAESRCLWTLTRKASTELFHERTSTISQVPIVCHRGVVRNFSANFVSSENPKVVDVSLDEDFEKALKDAEEKGKLAVTWFTATWCGPCRAISPAVDGLSVEYPDVSIIKVDIDEEGLQKTVTGAKVNAVPTFQFHKLGKVVAEVAGADRARLRELIDALHKD